MPYRAVRSRLTLADTWLLELYLGAYTLMWGLGYLNPFTDTFNSSPSYALLGRFPGGEALFGLLVTMLGITTIRSIIRGSRETRTVMLCLGGVFWFIILILIGVPTAWAAGGVPHFLLATLGHWFCWARLRYRGID